MMMIDNGRIKQARSVSIAEPNYHIKRKKGNAGRDSKNFTYDGGCRGAATDNRKMQHQ
jgi:hypothetical protein